MKSVVQPDSSVLHSYVKVSNLFLELPLTEGLAYEKVEALALGIRIHDQYLHFVNK